MRLLRGGMLSALALMAAVSATRASAAPAEAELVPALRQAICADRPCHLEHLRRLPARTVGEPLVDVMRWDLCGAPGLAKEARLRDLSDGVCAQAYYRVAWLPGAAPEIARVTVNGNRGVSGYGAGGGDESVRLNQAGELEHEIEGGSSWRWGVSRSWALQPALRLIKDSQQNWSRHQVEWGHHWGWTAAEDVLMSSGSLIACRRDKRSGQWAVPTGEEADTATVLGSAGADMPTLEAAVGFDWRSAALPTWLELRADAQPGPRRYTVALTKTAPPRSSLAVRLLRLPDRSVLLEWQGLDESVAAGQQPRLELWWWADPPTPARECLVPPGPRGQRPGMPAGEPPEGVQTIRDVYQVLLQADARVEPAFGRPQESGWSVELEPARVAGRQRWRLQLRPPADMPSESPPPAYALALSMRHQGRQHLVSHAALRYGDPSSLIQAVLGRDGGYWADPDQQWRDAVQAHDQALAPGAPTSDNPTSDSKP